jgi:hypothetical protein
MEDLLISPKIRTFMGKLIDPFKPDPELIGLVDIAHSLSNICRWNGHVMRFYSVAEHCIFVSGLVESREDKLAALLHDASEAYITDLTRPVKYRFPNYLDLEFDLKRVISLKFGFQFPLSVAVKDADDLALRWEYKNVVIADRVPTMTPREAKQAWLSAMDKLVCNVNTEGL